MLESSVTLDAKCVPSIAAQEGAPIRRMEWTGLARPIGLLRHWTNLKSSTHVVGDDHGVDGILLKLALEPLSHRGTTELFQNGYAVLAFECNAEDGYLGCKLCLLHRLVNYLLIATSRFGNQLSLLVP